MLPENLGVPLEGDRDVGALCGSHPVCFMICKMLHINSAVQDWACIQCLLMQEMPQTQAPEDGLVGDRCREPRLLEILGECPEGPPGTTGSPGL